MPAAGGIARTIVLGSGPEGYSVGMAGPSTDTVRFLTLEELARPFAAVRASPRDHALFLIACPVGCAPARSGCCAWTLSICGRCASGCIG